MLQMGTPFPRCFCQLIPGATRGPVRQGFICCLFACLYGQFFPCLFFYIFSTSTPSCTEPRGELFRDLGAEQRKDCVAWLRGIYPRENVSRTNKFPRGELIECHGNFFFSSSASFLTCYTWSSSVFFFSHKVDLDPPPSSAVLSARFALIDHPSLQTVAKISCTPRISVVFLESSSLTPFSRAF